ncbi:MAG: hypothetical protein J6D54_06290 [Olsenella sp.]|nr:hypothetical protein [Olsenella sp.]
MLRLLERGEVQVVELRGHKQLEGPFGDRGGQPLEGSVLLEGVEQRAAALAQGPHEAIERVVRWPRPGVRGGNEPQLLDPDPRIQDVGGVAEAGGLAEEDVVLANAYVAVYGLERLVGDIDLPGAVIQPFGLCATYVFLEPLGIKYVLSHE